MTRTPTLVALFILSVLAAMALRFLAGMPHYDFQPSHTYTLRTTVSNGAQDA